MTDVFLVEKSKIRHFISFLKTANTIAKKPFSLYNAVNGVSHSYETANICFDLSLYHNIQAGINVGLRGAITRQFKPIILVARSTVIDSLNYFYFKSASRFFDRRELYRPGTGIHDTTKEKLLFKMSDQTNMK